jgi:hypothetical protein
LSRRSRRPAAVATALACLALAACGIGGDGVPSNEELLGGEGLGRALEAVREEAGEDASVLTVQITGRGAEFHLVGEQTRSLIYTDGELEETELGAVLPEGALSEQAYPLGDVDPEAPGRLIDGAEALLDGELSPIAITLERSALDGELRWTLNAAGVAFSAGPDGSDPTPASGSTEQGL